jgi:hypothetical protein
MSYEVQTKPAMRNMCKKRERNSDIQKCWKATRFMIIYELGELLSSGVVSS